MKLELHILQNFSPSNLNRDDTGAPKDCELGGVRRARISSQCFKRAIRDAFVDHDLIPASERAARTKRITDRVGEQVAKREAIDLDKARRAATKALEAAGLKTDAKSDKTEYLLFVPTRAIDALADVVCEHMDVLSREGEEDSPEPSSDSKKKPKSKKGKKADAKQAADPEVKRKVTEILQDGARTPELALFGRMIADAPSWNVEAACQVAHAVSTNRLAMEFDFYTAIDDLKKDDTTGSDMMGTIPFNSACFYRYLVVDVGDLVRNLGSDDAAKEQARRTVSAFVRAAVLAVPSGKQNSMAAHNPPSLVMVDVGEASAPRSLANAFVEPVRPGRAGDLVVQSAVRLAHYAKALDDVYGSGVRKDRSFVVIDPGQEVAARIGQALPDAVHRSSLDALIAASVAAAFSEIT